MSGCVNDVTGFAEVLRDRVGADALDLVVLADGEATRSAVTTHLSDHLGRATAQDVAVFYFSGHGSQQATPEELWSIEPDRRNETLVCVDSRSPGSWDLADKELAGLLHGISASGCHTLVVLDCCHSGDGTRNADEVVRLAPPDPRSRPAATFVALDEPDRRRPRRRALDSGGPSRAARGLQVVGEGQGGHRRGAPPRRPVRGARRRPARLRRAAHLPRRAAPRAIR